jgi:hypothetical protein
MYKLLKNQATGQMLDQVLRLSDNATIPFDPANTDYANFKKEVLAGAELQDAEGVVMTQAEADAFIASLP